MHTARNTFLIILALLLALLAPPPVAAQTLSVTPGSGPPGTTFFFTGNGYEADELIDVRITTPRGVVRLSDARGREQVIVADRSGQVEWSYSVSEDARDGNYVVTASGVSSGREATVQFIVQSGTTAGATTAPAPTAGVRVTPLVGPPGTTFVFDAGGFAAGEELAIWNYTPGGGITPVSSAAGGAEVYVADSSGRVDWLVETFASTAPGVYTGVAQGVRSRLVRAANYDVRLDAPAPPPQPAGSAAVTPPIGPPGGKFAFVASGYEPNERIIISIQTPDGRVVPITGPNQSAVITANDNGRARWTLNVPADETLGLHRCLAQGARSDILRIIPFEVRPVADSPA